MRRPLPLLLCVFALGLACAALVACGGTKGGIPSSNASELRSQLDDVQAFVERGECTGLDGQLRQVQEGIDNLPSDVDAALRRNLNDGLDRLRAQSVEDCNDQRTQTQETTTTPTTETATQTTPSVTTPTATTPTQTTPTATTPAPTPPTPPTTDTGGVTPTTDDGTGGATPGADQGGAGVTP